MTVAVLRDADREAYARLVDADWRSLIYATWEYRTFLDACVPGHPRYLGAWLDGALVGALPLFVTQCDGLGKVVNSLPWYGSHGGCILAPAHADAARRALLDAYLEVCTESGVLSATLITSLRAADQTADYIGQLRPTAIDERRAQVTDLPAAGPDAPARLMARFLRPRPVRKALRQGFVFLRCDEDWAWRFLHETHAQNMAAINGKAKPWSHFSAIREHLPSSRRSLSLAMLDGEPTAALLLLRFNGAIEYFTPVISQAHRPRQPLSFLIWLEMLEAMEQGYRRWNWGGTWLSQTSLHHFKAGWGADDHPYAYLSIASAAGVSVMREHRDALSDAFPYYYCYPFDWL